MKIQNTLVLHIRGRSQRYLAHVTTVSLSWRVQNIVVIGRVYSKLERSEFSSNFEFDRNMLSGTGSSGLPYALDAYIESLDAYTEMFQMQNTCTYLRFFKTEQKIFYVGLQTTTLAFVATSATTTQHSRSRMFAKSVPMDRLISWWYSVTPATCMDTHLPLDTSMCFVSTCTYDIALRWRHNGRDSVSNHQPQDRLLKR